MSVALRLVRLLLPVLPVLVPFWRFFDVITASPRIDYGWSGAASDEPSHWHPYRPPPAARQACSLRAASSPGLEPAP